MKGGFTVKFILLLAVQVVLGNFSVWSPYVFLTFLPVMILCLPIHCGTPKAMLVAFAAGLVVDFLSTGQLGLSSAALVAVAACRKGIITLVFGSELFSRGEDISIERQGWVKMLTAILMATTVFLAVHIFLDSALTRPFWADLARFGASLVLSSVLSLYISSLFGSENGLGWK